MCDLFARYVHSPDIFAIGINDSIGVETASYNIQRVPRTNLFLLVVDATVDMMSDERLDTVPEEVKYPPEMVCERLQTEIHRKGPEECYASHPDEVSDECALASSLRPSSSFSLLLITLFCLMYNH